MAGTLRSTSGTDWHLARRLAVSVHGDDFSATGSETNLRWLEKVLGEAFEIKVEVLGPGSDHKQEIRILNRVLTWHSWGVGYEADPRHAEIATEQLGLADAKAVSTPGSKADQNRAHEVNGDDLVYLDLDCLSSSTPSLTAGESRVPSESRLTRCAPKLSKTNDGDDKVENLLVGEQATSYR